MAIAYMHLKIISRGNATQSRNCVGSAAYDSREKLHSLDNNHTYNYERKAGDLENKGILLPVNAPKEYQDRQTLWNAVEKAEKSGKAQLAREFILALPKESTAQQRKEMVEDFCNTAFVKEGMCVDYSIHKPDKGNENYHTHIKCTMRGIDEQGKWQSKSTMQYELDKNGNKIPVIDKKTGKQKIGAKGRKLYKTKTAKTNDWDKQENLEKWRHQAEVSINKYLPVEKQISMKSYERQGIDKLGQVHEGYYKNSEKVELNKQIRERNANVKDFEELEKTVNADVANFERSNKMDEQNRRETAEDEQKRLHKIALDERKQSDTIADTQEKQQQQIEQQQKEQQRQELSIMEQRDYEMKELAKYTRLKKEHQEQIEKMEKDLKKEKDELHRLDRQLADIEKNTHFWQNKDERKAKFMKEHNYHELKANVIKHEQELEKERHLQEQYQAEWVLHDKKHSELIRQSKSDLIKRIEQDYDKRQLEKEQQRQERQKEQAQKAEKDKKTIDRSKNTKARSPQTLAQFKGRDKGRDRGGWSR